VIIWKADKFIPEEKYLATPGHIIGLDKETKKIKVACIDGFLEISEIEVEGKIMAPYEFVKSIRARFKNA